MPKKIKRKPCYPVLGRHYTWVEYNAFFESKHFYVKIINIEPRSKNNAADWLRSVGYVVVGSGEPNIYYVGQILHEKLYFFKRGWEPVPHLDLKDEFGNE